MNRHRSRATLVMAIASFSMACEKSPAPAAEQPVPSLAAGGADKAGPFDIAVTGAKTANASGNDATFCASAGARKLFTLSLVAPTWAVSIGGLVDRPGVGTHAMVADVTDLIDKTTGSSPTEWVHHPTTGTLTITRADDSRQSGTYDVTTVPGGQQPRAQGKFEAVSFEC